MVVNTIAGYLFLQRALSTFLHMVSVDPRLYSEHRGLLVISLSRVLTISRYEIRRFVFYDIMCALVLGVPPLAEYNFGDSLESSLPIEGFHGIPAQWVVDIGYVHHWRSTQPEVLNQDDWGSLESRTLAWKPRMVELYSEESTELIARMAVQESWRHATLIYIYMVRAF